MREYLVNSSKKQKIMIIVGLLIVIVIVFIFVYKYFYDDNSTEQLLQKEGNTNEINNQISNEISNSDTVQGNSKIGLHGNNKKTIVHIIGEVKNPGVVKLEDGARIIDAIEAAGGKTEDADLSKVNLAYVIEDGIQIYVPRIGEVQNQSQDQNENKQETYIREGAGEGVITESLVQNESKDVKVNINTASIEKIQTLPGVGESTAKKIIQYREQNGKYQTIEDLKNVNGIGESKFNNIKDYITI